MSGAAFLQFALFLLVLLALAKPLGEYLGAVLEQERTLLDRLLNEYQAKHKPPVQK